MTRNPTAPTPPSPWTGRVHLALTTTLFVAAVSIAGLAVAGRVKFGEAGKVGKPEEGAKSEGGRYRIRKVESVHEIIERAGKNFFQTEMYDTWVFEYRGGLLQATLETDEGVESVKVATVPDNWKQAIPLENHLAKDSDVPVNFTGYIILTAVRSLVSNVEALEPYHAHLGGFFAFGSLGPLNLVPTVFLEVKQVRPYRIFVSASPPSDVNGMGFNINDHERPVLISTPLVIRNPALEDVNFGGGKDLKPGVDELLLERQRGYSRLRLKARFLTDGEARELLPK